MIFFRSGECCKRNRLNGAFHVPENYNIDNCLRFWRCALQLPKLLLSVQSVLIMKLTFLLTMFVIMNASANSYSQTVTFTGKDVPLEKVLSSIRIQTGYVFFYKESLLNEAKPVTLNVVNADLSVVLNACFKNQPFDY